jgi:hypothetical protein
MGIREEINNSIERIKNLGGGHRIPREIPIEELNKILSLISEEKREEWVSVDDRLPDDFQSVLVSRAGVSNVMKVIIYKNKYKDRKYRWVIRKLSCTCVQTLVVTAINTI